MAQESDFIHEGLDGMRHENFQSVPLGGDYYPEDHDPERSVSAPSDAYGDEDQVTRSLAMDYGSLPFGMADDGGFGGDAYSAEPPVTRSLGGPMSDMAFGSFGVDPYAGHMKNKFQGQFDLPPTPQSQPILSDAPALFNSTVEAKPRPSSVHFEYQATHVVLPADTKIAAVCDQTVQRLRQWDSCDFSVKPEKLSFRITLFVRMEPVGLQVKVYQDPDMSYVVEFNKNKGESCKFVTVFCEVAQFLAQNFRASVAKQWADCAPPPDVPAIDCGPQAIVAEDMDPFLSFFDSQYQQDHVEGLQAIAAFLETEEAAKAVVATALFETEEAIRDVILRCVESHNPEAAYSSVTVVARLVGDKQARETMVKADVPSFLVRVAACQQEAVVLQKTLSALDVFELCVDDNMQAAIRDAKQTISSRS
mmetsp:Transcript_1475/g.3511  ORF Transcript_1475/g.3511 Transcript_1475/m.3511 type:complete len:420 (-) Transcript_1475:145-1404(-)